jgi:NAD(P)-dependent dehydrogenase (short-subunit alcohol dehydrogenase family)
MRNIVSLEGKTVVVTGAGQGIGRATIKLARELGANAVAIDLNRDTLSTYDASDRQLMTITGSVTDEAFATDAVEVKRMFVQPAHRGQGVAQAVLAELEKWAAELHYAACVLETGKKQPEAIALYKRSGYTLTPNYGQYIGVENSVCMRKELVG